MSIINDLKKALKIGANKENKKVSIFKGGEVSTFKATKPTKHKTIKKTVKVGKANNVQDTFSTKKKFDLNKVKRFENRIGFCSDKTLNIESNGKGHYVFIRKIKEDGTCDVSTITSLEDKEGKFNNKRLSRVRSGQIYSIPKFSTNFNLWSGVNNEIIENVSFDKICRIGLKNVSNVQKEIIIKHVKNTKKKK